MVLIELAVAGGVVAAGMRVYQKNRNKPTLGQLLATPRSVTSTVPADNSNGALVPANVQEALRDFLLYGKLPIQGRAEETGTADAGVLGLGLQSLQEIERQTNQMLVIGTISLGLATVGVLGFPLFSLLSLPPLIYLSVPFIVSGYVQLVRERQIGLHVIDAVTSVGILALGQFLPAGIFFVLYGLSLKLMLKSFDTAQQRLVSILGDTPKEVWVRYGDVETRVPLEQVRVGDRVVVHTGEMIPVDGTIMEGIASIDQRALTGESQPVERGVGDIVYAATVVLSGTIDLVVQKAGQDTVAAQIGEVLSRTTSFTSSLDLKGRMIADRSVMPTLLISLLTLPFLGPTSAVTVLFSYFGYTMRFISPLSVLNFLSLATSHSILIKDGRALEVLTDVDTVVFDKTGTLTQEQPLVNAIHVCQAYTPDEVLYYGAAAEYKQTHPIARAILQAAQERALELPTPDAASYEVGYGLKVGIDGRQVRVGSARFMENEGIVVPPEIVAVQTECHEQGHSLVYIGVDEHLAGAIELHAAIRPEARQIIEGLHNRGLTIYVISGDHTRPTHHLAQSLGIDYYFAEVLPEDKSRLVAQLQKEGRKVCFVGDGINDAIALKKADVSVSLSGASTIATDTAQIVLMDESLEQLVNLFDLAYKLDLNMRGNLAVSIIPGVVVIGGVYLLKFGILAASVVNFVGIGMGVANAMLPALTEFQQKRNGLTANRPKAE